MGDGADRLCAGMSGDQTETPIARHVQLRCLVLLLSVFTDNDIRVVNFVCSTNLQRGLFLGIDTRVSVLEPVACLKVLWHSLSIYTAA